MSPEQNAQIYSGKQKAWHYVGTERADIYVAGYGWGTAPGGSQSCDDASNDGTKRLGKFALTGDRDDDGFFGTGPVIALQVSNKYGNQLCDGDSGGPWSLLRAGRHLLFGVHSGSRTSTSWSAKKWAAIVAPKFDWIIKTTRDKGLPIECSETVIRDHRSGTMVDATYKTCRDVQ